MYEGRRDSAEAASALVRAFSIRYNMPRAADIVLAACHRARATPDENNPCPSLPFVERACVRRIKREMIWHRQRQ